MKKNWKYIKEELPGEDRHLILLKNEEWGEGPIIGYYDPERKCFYPVGCADYSFPIMATHWCAIPGE